MRRDLRANADEGWIDRSRSPYAEGDLVWVPVRDGEAWERDLPARRQCAGRGFFMLGDVAVVHGQKPLPSEVEMIVAGRHPRGLIWIEALDGLTRTPRAELLWGEGGEVCHHENHQVYVFDPMKVMFSQGNRNEKVRMAELVRAGHRTERVADMFAGIGYFTIPVAAGGADVHAIEINPTAYVYLERNVCLNHLSGRVRTSLGNSGNLLTGIYDRIIMGHFDALTLLPAALRHVRSGSVIHLHSVGPVEEPIRVELEKAGFSAVVDVHRVKKYRPHVWHVVQDIAIV